MNGQPRFLRKCCASLAAMALVWAISPLGRAVVQAQSTESARQPLVESAADESVAETQANPFLANRTSAKLIVVPIRYAEAKRIRTLLQPLYANRGVTVVSNEQTNALLISGDPRTLEELLHVIKELDVAQAYDPLESSQPFAFSSGSLRGFQFRAGRTEELQEQYERLERQTHEVAARVRKASADSEDRSRLRSELESSVREAFKARQELERAELARFARRLQEIQQSIEMRDRIGEQIVARRVDELLDPNLRWPAAKKTEPAGRLADEGDQQVEVESARGTGAARESVGGAASADRTADQLFRSQRPATGPEATQREAGTGQVPRDLVIGRTADEFYQAMTDLADQIQRLEELTRRLTRHLADGREEVRKTLGETQKQLKQSRLREMLAWQEYRRQVELLKANLNYASAQWEAAKSAVEQTEKLFKRQFVPLLELERARVEEKRAEVSFRQAEALLEVYEQVAQGLDPPSMPEDAKFNDAAAPDADAPTANPPSFDAPPDDAPPANALRTDAPSTASPDTDAPVPLGRTELDTSDTTKEPRSAAERAVAKLVHVFFQDQARRAVPCVVIRVDGQCYAVTTMPACLVPDGMPHAIDRVILEWGNSAPVAAEYDPRSTKELAVYRLTGDAPCEPLKVGFTPSENGFSVVLSESLIGTKSGETLTAVHPTLWHQLRFEETTVRATDARSELNRPDRDLSIDYVGLIEVDRALPEGTPLLKMGKLAGLTLLGSRLLEGDANRSYVLPAHLLAELGAKLRHNSSATEE